MPDLAVGAGAHHERPDGKGYPNQLSGAEIPRVAQIIAVADTFDAMYSNRPYRKRMDFEKAVSIIREIRGRQLTEDVVDAFLRLVEQGKFRAPDDNGGGTLENIDNIQQAARLLRIPPRRLLKNQVNEDADPMKTAGMTELCCPVLRAQNMIKPAVLPVPGRTAGCLFLYHSASASVSVSASAFSSAWCSLS